MTAAGSATPDGVHVLPLDIEFEGHEMNLYPSAVETGRGLLLLDTGFRGTVTQLEDRLEAVGYGLDDVATVLVTHQDGDHVGSLATVLERVDPFVVAHERDAPAVDGRTGTRGPDDSDRYPPARVDLELGGEATFLTRVGPAHVLPTPGHTQGHVSVYLPEERFLIAADALTADDDGLAGPSPDFTGDMDQALASVARLGELDVDATLCYHGGLVDDGSDRITEIGET